VAPEELRQRKVGVKSEMVSPGLDEEPGERREGAEGTLAEAAQAREKYASNSIVLPLPCSNAKFRVFIEDCWRIGVGFDGRRRRIRLQVFRNGWGSENFVALTGEVNARNSLMQVQGKSSFF